MNNWKPLEPGPKNDSVPMQHQSFDTSPSTGMQGEQLLVLSSDVQAALFFETVQDIYVRVFRELKPKTPLLGIDVKYRRFVNVNSSIRLQEGKISVKLPDLLEGAPAPVVEALARILLGKLFRKPAAAADARRYRLYLNRKDIRRQIQLLRQARGRKYISGPVGNFFNLAEVFEKLNGQYFDGLLGQPELGWSFGRSRFMLGHFDPSHNAIIISRIFDERTIPPIALDYVMFHEMLHLQFPVDHSGVRRRVHTKDFREAEKQFLHRDEAKAVLKTLT